MLTRDTFGSALAGFRPVSIVLAPAMEEGEPQIRVLPPHERGERPNAASTTSSASSSQVDEAETPGGAVRAVRAVMPSYLQLVAAEPSPPASWTSPSAAPTPLEAAQRRLAVSMLLSHRLSDQARHVDDVDIAEQIARRMLGFDHFMELEKLQSFGEEAAMARSCVVAAPSHNGYANAGLVPSHEIPPICWRYFGDGCTTVQAGGFRVAGHSFAEYNGTYEAVDERDGWPVLRNEHGRWLYRPSHRGLLSSNSWTLWKEHTPEMNKCNAYIDAPDGSFPVGEQTWEVWSEGAGRFELGALQLRVMVRVRCFAFSNFFLP